MFVSVLRRICLRYNDVYLHLSRLKTKIWDLPQFCYLFAIIIFSILVIFLCVFDGRYLTYAVRSEPVFVFR